jgi:hypothetical protein
MSNKVVELIFCVSSSGSFSRTFRVFVSGSGESTEDVAGILRENSKSIVMSHQGIINDDDVEAAAVGVELISSFFGPEWYLNELGPEASGGFAKVNTGPGSTLDVYKFMHDLYGPTVG